MEKNFWKTLARPIVALAPMANVTDAAFRRIIAKYGKPDVLYTEFTSVEGLLSEGREKLLMDFWYGEEERPIVAQIFGSKPEQFYEVAKLCHELKFDGIDINMGCPDRGIEKSGAGAALIKNPALAKEIIQAAKEGGGGLPVSVKTRIGYNTNSIEEWTAELAKTDPAAIILHLRTRKEMSKVPARWEEIEKAKNVLDKIPSGKRPLLIGNGDVLSVREARAKARQYGIDGVMIGRGIFGNPWLFADARKSRFDTTPGESYIPSIEERLRVCLEHTKLFEELYKKEDVWLKPFNLMKKHYKAYIRGEGFSAKGGSASGGDGAKELRLELMAAEDTAAVENILRARQ